MLRCGDNGHVRLELPQDGLEPPRALEPPMAEELRVEVSDDDARAPRLVRMLAKRLPYEAGKMGRVGSDPILRGRGVVGNLRVERKTAVRDPPIPESTRSLLPMEFQVRAVPRIAVVRAPDLHAGP